jgi:hypothetical protein
MNEVEFASVNDPQDVSVPDVCVCQICESLADRLKTGIFACQRYKEHMADSTVGLWSDLSVPLGRRADQ